MSIAFNEASSIGVDTFVRVGSTGTIQKEVSCGDIIISSAAMRLDATSNYYIMPEYPAVASYEVLLALVEAAERLKVYNYHVGVMATTSDFYAGQSRSVSKSYSNNMENLLPTLQRAGILSFDMETATLFTLASLHGSRACSVCAVFANRCTNEFKPGAGEENAIRIANEAVKILSEWDDVKRKKRKQWLFPSLIHTEPRRTEH
jgi:uridine phosphorylase